MQPQEEPVGAPHRQAEYRSGSLPVPAPRDLAGPAGATRRLYSCAPGPTYTSFTGLAETGPWQRRSAPTPVSSGVEDDIPDYRAATPEWDEPQFPTARSSQSGAPSFADDEGTAPNSSVEESRRYSVAEEGPPMPAQIWSAFRQRQQQVTATQPAVEESPPWWWYPCYHADPETPWYDPKEKFGGDGFWEPALCADHIYIACKMAVSDAINNQEKQFAKAWDTSLTNLQEMFDQVDYDWMPKVAKKPEKPVDNNYYVHSTFDREMIGCHYNLQVVSVPVDQIILDEQRGNGDFLPIWFSVKTHLRQVLCDAECGLFHMDIPKRDVPRSVMPDALRDVHGFNQQVRDWVIFRDYKNLMQFYEHIFLRHAFYQ